MSVEGACAEPQVLDVVDGLVEELGDVVVVEAVDDTTAVALPGDEAEGAQEAELVGDGGLFHADGGGEFGDRVRGVAQGGEDQQSGGGGQCLEGGGYRRGGGLVERSVVGANGGTSRARRATGECRTRAREPGRSKRQAL